MKKIRNLIIIALIIIFNSNIVFANTSDIQNHWAYNQIMRGINNNWINGYEDNTFKPDNNIKRNEFIKILVSTKKDISSSDENWDKPYIDYAKDINILENNDEDYNKPIDRKEVFEIIYNYINISIEELNMEYENSSITDIYKDIDKSNEKVIFLLNEKIVNGYPDNTIKLDNQITRAEAITIINKAIDYTYNVNSLYKYDNSIFNKKDIYKYTNYFGNNELFLNTYKVKDKKVLYYDTGRLGKYSDRYIEKYNEYIYKILLELICKNEYVLNTYDEEEKCVYIAFGENQNYLDNGNSLFEVILYEESKNIDDFKYDIKINVYKLWKELNDIKENNKINKYNLIKLINLLKVFLSNQDLNNVISVIEDNPQFYRNENYYIKNINNNYYIYLNLFK